MHIHPAGLGERRSRADGFTLIEVMIASIVVLVAAVGAATALMSSNKIALNSSSRSQVESAIDQDVANLKDAAYDYTYCSGSYTFSGATCNSVGPGQEDYYFPNSVTQLAWADTFTAACNAGTLSNALITAINGGASSLALSSVATNLGITRDSAVLDNTAGASGEKSHDIRITYNYKGVVVRRVLVSPAAAAWCP